MGETTGFLKWKRETPTRRPVPMRVQDWQEVYTPFPRESLVAQAGRCMDCGIPFCNNGCPLGNLIPDWNDLVYRDHWRDAIERLHATNNFPEFTGRLCPAPCEVRVRAGHQPGPGHDQAGRAGDRRPRLERRLDHAAPAGGKTGQTRGRDWLRTIRTGRGAAASRARGTTWWCSSARIALADLLRYGIPEFKLEKRHLESAHRADARRRDGVSHRAYRG